MIEILILWVYFSLPWTLGPVPMTEGWYAVYSWIEPTVQDRQDCQAAVRRAEALKLIATCRADTPEGPLAEIRR